MKENKVIDFSFLLGSSNYCDNQFSSIDKFNPIYSYTHFSNEKEILKIFNGK